MNLDILKNDLMQRNKKYLDIDNYFSVLLPLIHIDGELHILFQVRSHMLNNQPGEICFPGGRLEDFETPLESAVRETIEELNITENQIEILGELDILTTPFNMVLYPFCGLLKDINNLEDIQFNKQEVNSLFTVPINELLSTTAISYPLEINFKSDENFPYHLIENGEKYKWKTGSYPVFFYQYKDYIIWGLTAKILNHFLSFMKDI